MAQVPPVVVAGGDSWSRPASPPVSRSMSLARSPRPAVRSSITTTARWASMSTCVIRPRTPAPTVSRCGPSTTARRAPSSTVTVVVPLLVTVAATGPGTGCQSSGSRTGVAGPPEGELEDEPAEDGGSLGVEEAGGPGEGLESADDPSPVVQAVEARTPTRTAATAARTSGPDVVQGVREVGTVAPVGVAPLHALDERLGGVEELLVPGFEVAHLGGLA